METDRSTRSSSRNTHELFVSFSSHIPSPSMKFSLLAPTPHREALQRLRRNGSIKTGQASPMFARKRGGVGFENPEPSSPKVTCIGQVRVRSRKSNKKSAPEKRDSSNHRLSRFNWKSFHLNCFLCSLHERKDALKLRSVLLTCFKPVRKKEIKMPGGGDTASLRTERKARREIEVGETDVVKLDTEVNKEDENVGFCLPPKNALLLMRCRSDPAKMEALAKSMAEDAPTADIQSAQVLLEAEDEQESVCPSVSEEHVLNCGEVLEEDTDSHDTHHEYGDVADSIKENQEMHLQYEDGDHHDFRNSVSRELEHDECREEKVQGLDLQSGTASKREKEEGEEEEGSIVGERLPECLLLMMCEPKLSMEVSKETWVCNKDLVKLIPAEKPQSAIEDCKKMTSANLQRLQNPPRNIPCPSPLQWSSVMARRDHKPARAKGYEPCALARCKSEPGRPTSRIVPEFCFLKNRSMESHRPSMLEIRTTGLGF